MAFPEQTLDELDSVAWDAIEHAYGMASDVPDQIRGLLTLEGSALADTLGKLDNNLNHQGSLYPATCPALPFLLAAFRRSESIFVRMRLTSLFSRMLGGASHYADHPDEELYSAAEAGHPFTARDVVQCVATAAPAFAENLAAPDIKLRMYSAHLLGTLLRDDGDEVIPADLPDRNAIVEALVRAIDADTHPLSASSALFALGATLDSPGIWPLLERSCFDESALPAVRVAAALVLVDSGRVLPEGVVALLLETLKQAPGTDLLFQDRPKQHYSPWVMGSLRYTLTECLCRYSAGRPKRMDQVLPALLVPIGLASEYTIYNDVDTQFRWLWPARRMRLDFDSPGPPPRILPPLLQPAEVTEIARKVLEACVENEAIWTYGRNPTFENAGLPDTRESLRALLSAAGPTGR